MGRIAYCTAREPEFCAFVEAPSYGTAQAKVSVEAILRSSLVAPSGATRDAFKRECPTMLDRILSSHAKFHPLATLRDTLLPKLLSGETQITNIL